MINSQHYAHHVALVGMIHLLSLSESIEQLTQNTLWQTALILNLLLTSLLLFSTWSRKDYTGDSHEENDRIPT